MDVMMNIVMMYEGREFDHDLVIHDDNVVVCSGETYSDFINQCSTNFGESQSYDEYKKEIYED